MRGKPNADLRDQGCRSGGSFLEEVKRLVALKDSQLRRLTYLLGEFDEQRTSKVL